MRIATLVLAFAAACGASPALAQARILTVQDQTQPPPQTLPAAPAQEQASPPAPVTTPAQPSAQAPLQAPAPTQVPAQAQEQSKAPPESQGESQAKRQDRAPPPGRYGFTRVDNGLLRLDHESGDVAYCTPRDAGWSCEAVPQKGASLEQQIAELRGEVAALEHLRDEVADLQREIVILRPPHFDLTPPQTVPPAPSPPPDNHTGGITLKLPTQQDIARARGFIADTWHRLVEMIENLQKDMMRKGGGADGVSRT